MNTIRAPNIGQYEKLNIEEKSTKKAPGNQRQIEKSGCRIVDPICIITRWWDSRDSFQNIGETRKTYSRKELPKSQ